MENASELLVYKASAGSGKTFTLAVEYIKLLITNPAAYRNILAVTFTNKATTEMKERILGQLFGIAIGDPSSEAYLKVVCDGLGMTPDKVRSQAHKALSLLIHDYSRFRVETIDSFFQSVMRNLARELELGANMNIALNNEEVLSDAVDAMIEQLDRRSPVLVWLLEFIRERIASDKRWNVSGEIKSFGRNIFDETYIERGEGLREKLADPQTIPLYKKRLESMQAEAKDVMTPRVVVASAPEDMTMRDFYHSKDFCNYSRIPVYSKDEDNITGYVLRQAILERLAEDKFDMHLADILRPILAYQESTPVSTIWEQMLEKKEHISIIVDEYGALRGIVTMEDIIETALGFEIVDERDAVTDMQKLARERWQKRQAEAGKYRK